MLSSIKAITEVGQCPTILPRRGRFVSLSSPEIIEISKSSQSKIFEHFYCGQSRKCFQIVHLTLRRVVLINKLTI